MLDKISAYCSIAGFIISLLTLGYAFFIEKKVREFEKKVLFNIRIPSLIKSLKFYNSQLSKNLEEKNERSIRETLNLCRTIVKDVYPKLSGELRIEAVVVSKKLKRQYKSDFQFENIKKIKLKFWNQITTLDDLWESYDNLNSLIMRVESNKMDQKTIR